MSMRLKVKDNLKLERDVSTNAIINTDVSSYETAILRRAAFLKKDVQIAALQTSVETLQTQHAAMQEQIEKLITINNINNSTI